MPIVSIPTTKIYFPPDIQHTLQRQGFHQLSPDQCARLLLHGNLCLIHASQQPEHRDCILLMEMDFYRDGRSTFSLVWCYNPKAEGQPFFWRICSTDETNVPAGCCSFSQMETDLRAYVNQG